MLFTIGTNCGLRISDIVAINVGDVKNKIHIQITEKKTGKYKKFYINAKLKPMLENFNKDKFSNEPLFTTIFNNRTNKFGAYYVKKNQIWQKILVHTQSEKLLGITITKNPKVS